MKVLLICCYVLAFIIIQTGDAFSQADTSFNGISFAGQIIGKPLSTIKDSLFDNNGNFVKDAVNKKKTAIIFRCIPVNQKTLFISNIKFEVLNIVADTMGIVTGVSFQMSYFSKEVTTDKKLFRTGYHDLVEYLRARLQVDGPRKSFIDENSYSQERIVWEKELLKYTVITQQSKKIKKVRPYYDLILEIFENNSVH